jgi:glycosyltransferase involved in cell wall biosynthesis
MTDNAPAAARPLRIHFHSDNASFSGCENMLANFFGDDGFMARHRVSFTYRWSEEYEAGLKSRVPAGVDVRPLRLPDTMAIRCAITSPVLALLARVLFYVVPVKWWFIRRNARVIERELAGEGVDVLHVNNGGYPGAYSCASAVIAARRLGIARIVYVVNNIAVPYRSLPRVYDIAVDRMVARTVSRFVTGSTFAGRELARVLGLPAGRLSTIPNGITERPEVEGPAEVLLRLGLDRSRPLVGVVANFEKRKGQIHLLRALALLKARGHTPLPRVVLDGEGAERPALESYVRDAGLDGDALFVGREEHIFDFMAAMDVIALPSVSHEDFPNVVIEAMSLGKPVVASRLAGTPEQITDMETGILVEPGDERGLADALALVCGDEALRAGMGRAARAAFEARFRASDAVRAYEALYEELGTPGR